MAALISQPDTYVTALRNVEYVFSMPDIGTAPEKKYLIYMLKVDNVNVYSEYKVYNPVENNQQITIDFSKDIRGLLAASPPPFGISGLVAHTTIIRSITVEYGERTINTETCEDAEDDIHGESNDIDVLNGINRITEFPIDQEAFHVLSNRPKFYSIHRGSKDFLYVTGVCTVRVKYYNQFLLSQSAYSINQTHPGAVVQSVPVGSNGAHAATQSIKVTIDELVSAENPEGFYCHIDLENCQNNDGSVYDLYIQNHLGGVDLITFDETENVAMNVIKQELVNRYDSGDVAVLLTGQRKSVNNISYPTLTLKKTFPYVDYAWTKFLNEVAASSNAWLVIRHDSGSLIPVRVIILDATPQTYGDETEFIITIKFSEVELYPT